MKKKTSNIMIPLTNEFLKDKNINDLIYSYLQLNSSFDYNTKQRYIEKEKTKSINKMYKDIQDIRAKNNIGFCSYNKFSKGFKVIINSLLINESIINNKQVYILNEFTPNKIIPYETINFLTSVCNDNVIKVYVYLLNKFDYSNNVLKRNYMFTMGELAESIGYSKTNTVYIKNILQALKDFKLIDYKITKVKIPNNNIVTKQLELLNVSKNKYYDF